MDREWFGLKGVCFQGGRGWIGDGNGDIGGQVLVFPTAATKRHRSMGKHRRTVLSDFSFSPVDRSSVSS